MSDMNNDNYLVCASLGTYVHYGVFSDINLVQQAMDSYYKLDKGKYLCDPSKNNIKFRIDWVINLILGCSSKAPSNDRIKVTKVPEGYQLETCGNEMILQLNEGLVCF